MEVKRELLEQAVDKLLTCWPKSDPLVNELRAALAAPAAAPEPICTKCGDVITAHDPGLCGCCLSTRDATSPVQPSWQDAPTKPGMWLSDDFEGISTFNSDDIQAFKTSTGVRWFGPIPEDKP